MFNFIKKKNDKKSDDKRAFLEVRLGKNTAMIDELKYCLDEMTSAGINKRSKAYNIIVAHIDALVLEQNDIYDEIANLNQNNVKDSSTDDD